MPIFWVFRFVDRVVYFFHYGLVVEYIFYHFHKEVHFATLLLLLLA